MTRSSVPTRRAANVVRRAASFVGSTAVCRNARGRVRAFGRGVGPLPQASTASPQRRSGGRACFELTVDVVFFICIYVTHNSNAGDVHFIRYYCICNEGLDLPARSAEGSVAFGKAGSWPIARGIRGSARSRACSRKSIVTRVPVHICI